MKYHKTLQRLGEEWVLIEAIVPHANYTHVNKLESKRMTPYIIDGSVCDLFVVQLARSGRGCLVRSDTVTGFSSLLCSENWRRDNYDVCEIKRRKRRKTRVTADRSVQ